MSADYECHITCYTSQAEAAAEVAKEFHWKTSEIARDPLLGDDTYFYLTSHGATYEQIFTRMKATVDALTLRGVRVAREKIEHIVYDTKKSLVTQPA